MVEVFKTNVADKSLAEMVVEILYRELPECRINFDLDDCDRILRIEGEILPVEMIREMVRNNGILCEILL
ncbi:MAG: hypothetical protein ABIW47_10055 [Ginsengibacter sp.]|jgi:predicted SAM-dependent methyltransferase